MPGQRAQSFLFRIAAIAVVAMALYLGRDLLMPLAMAILLSFLLSPVADRLERTGIGRAPAVAILSLLLAGGVVLAAWFVTRELTDLFAGLPDFRAHLAAKLNTLRGPLRSVADAMGWIEQLSREVAPSSGARTPRVEVVERPDWFALLGQVVSPVLGPLAFAGIVTVLTLFILYQRDDLRRRVIRLLGTSELPFTARALDEAGRRVSRYLGRQVLLCTAHGTAVGVGLFLLGVPGAGLFALLSGGLRLIPYVGPWIAALLPTALATAAFPGWTLGLSTAAFFVALELISNNLLEPWIYGAGAGLTPFGVVFCAVFWAWLWGGVGLFLAVPLTVCGVVLGRYLPQLAFFTTLFGEEPERPPHVQLYESMVWNEGSDVAQILREHGSRAEPVARADALVLPALARVAESGEQGRASRGRSGEVVALLSARLDETFPPPENPPPLRSTRRVVLPSAPSPAEHLARTWVVRVLRERGFAAELGPRAGALATAGLDSPSEAAPHAVVVLFALTRKSAARASRRAPQLALARGVERVVVVAWSLAHASSFAALAGGDPITGDPERRVAAVHSCAQLIAELEACAEAKPTAAARP
jgi:predicted PurR-regulated permease PerM